MERLKIWYSTTIRTDDTEEYVFKNFPDEITYEARRGKIRLVKEAIETVGDQMQG